MCSKKNQPWRTSKLPRFNKEGSITIGKWLGNSASFFKKEKGYRARRSDFIRECLLPLLRQGLSKDSKEFSSVMEDFLSGIVPDPKGLQREQEGDLTTGRPTRPVHSCIHRSRRTRTWHSICSSLQISATLRRCGAIHGLLRSDVSTADVQEQTPISGKPFLIIDPTGTPLLRSTPFASPKARGELRSLQLR